MSAIISYAQNFEDVMLWRALKHVENGFYIDLGAQDPLVDSVSLAFHERGWKGIHVEPTPHYAQLLRAQRPGDTVIEAAVSDEGDLLTFFEIPDTGISTADPQIAQQHRERGFVVREITVPSVRLSSIFKSCGKQDIHWMKIDVEGFEWNALTSWGKATARPWIVVVESTLPMTQIESHRQWEPMLLRRGYTPAYFDGLNRYYIFNKHPELLSAFLSGPNVFDGFTFNGTGSVAFWATVEQRYKSKLTDSATNLLAASGEIEDLKRNLTAREADLGAQLREYSAQLDARKDQLLLLEQVRAQREEAFSAQSNQQAQQKEVLLRQLVAMEHETAAKFVEWQQKADSEREQLHHRYFERERELELRQLSSQEVSTSQIDELRKQLLAARHDSSRELDALRREAQQREQYLQEQFESTQRTAGELRQQIQAQNENYRRELEERDRHAKGVEDTSRSRELALLTQLDSLQAMRLGLLQNIHRLRTHVLAMRSSLSWRLTGPARTVSSFFFPSDAMGLNEDLDSITRESEPPGNSLRESVSPVLFSAPTDSSMQSSTNAVLPGTAESGLTVKELAAVDDQEFLRSAYRLVLGRESDWQGNSHYLGQLQAGSSRLLVLAQLRLSSEGMARAANLPQLDDDLAVATNAKTIASTFEELMGYQGFAFVRAAYITLFGREPDTAGKENCIAQLLSGSAKIEILTQLRESTEGQLRSVNLQAIANAVRRFKVSQKTVTEDPAAGAESQESQSRSKTPTINEMLNCDEQEFIRLAFWTMLGRQPDPNAFGTYLNHLAAGIPRMQILSDIAASLEAVNRAKFVARIESAIQQYRLARVPFIGAVSRLFMTQIEKQDDVSRTLRAQQFENVLWRERLEQRTAQIEFDIAISKVKYLELANTTPDFRTQLEGDISDSQPQNEQSSEQSLGDVDTASLSVPTKAEAQHQDTRMRRISKPHDALVDTDPHVLEVLSELRSALTSAKKAGNENSN